VIGYPPGSQPTGSVFVGVGADAGAGFLVVDAIVMLPALSSLGTKEALGGGLAMNPSLDGTPLVKPY